MTDLIHLLRDLKADCEAMTWLELGACLWAIGCAVAVIVLLDTQALDAAVIAAMGRGNG